MKRAAGILLHPTSLPGPYGIGTLGKGAFAWIDTLQAAGQTLWQILPLGPVGFGDSPYQSYSAFAGSPSLIDPEMLIRDGLLDHGDLADAPQGESDRVDFDAAQAYNVRWLARAVERFRPDADFERFCRDEAFWLEDYALFMALRDHFALDGWLEWPDEIRTRRHESVAYFHRLLAQSTHHHRVVQYFFFQQWDALHTYATQKGIAVVGDLPIYVSAESADLWAHPQNFILDDEGRPSHVAGVPPDYFSATGQRWGNPLYDWEVMRREGFTWWIARLRTNLRMYDYVRIDHFRGFESYWSIPAEEETAIKGEWLPGPDHALFEAFEATLGKNLPIIAEDLGVITPEVEALRDDFALPGMKILQFAFGGDAGNPYLPHNHVPNSVVYTGTHDNDTTNGWFYSLPQDSSEREYLLEYLQCGIDAMHLTMIRTAFASSAVWAVIPMQDLIGYGTVARMNVPGTALGNWHWRLSDELLHRAPWDKLKQMTSVYGRIPAEPVQK